MFAPVATSRALHNYHNKNNKLNNAIEMGIIILYNTVELMKGGLWYTDNLNTGNAEISLSLSYCISNPLKGDIKN